MRSIRRPTIRYLSWNFYHRLYQSPMTFPGSMTHTPNFLRDWWKWTRFHRAYRLLSFPTWQDDSAGITPFSDFICLLAFITKKEHQQITTVNLFLLCNFGIAGYSSLLHLIRGNFNLFYFIFTYFTVWRYKKDQIDV